MTSWVRLEYGLYLEKCLKSRSERKSWWQIREGLEYQAEEFGVIQALGRKFFSRGEDFLELSDVLLGAEGGKKYSRPTERAMTPKFKRSG